MKLSAASAVLALTSTVFAAPVEEVEVRAIDKRATCVFYGYSYPCFRPTTVGSGGSSPTAAPTTPASTPAPAPTSGGGSSTGGSSRYTRGSTANDITTPIGCTPLTVIFARGTSEPGNVGSISGAPMFQRLIADLGATGVTLQGVDYAASAAGNANCGSQGSAEMADLVADVLGRCPNTKIALSGYSQGACVVHRAVERAGVNAADVDAVVLFGDPLNGSSVGSVPSSKVLEICATGDSICSRGGTSPGASGGHLSYGNNAQQAASFIEDATR